MRKILLLLVTAALMSLVEVHAAPFIPQNSNRTTINLDSGWLFTNTNSSNFSEGTGFNDANWSKVCVPHANVITKHAYMDTASYKIISWYRRHFTPPASFNNQRFRLEFEGVAVIATVYVNGSAVGSPHKGAYTPFTIDITDKVKVGQDNVIAVKVDSKRHGEIPPEGRENLDFMVFGGIVRPVTLIVTDPLYVDWVFVATQNPLQTAPVNPVVNAKTQIINSSSTQKNCTIITTIVDEQNNVVAASSAQATIPAKGKTTVTQTTSAIANPRLWSVDKPNLYTAFVQVQDASGFVDAYKTRMGIRSLTLSKTDGKCYLNGKPLKLRGLNRHETYPYIGRAAPKRLQRKDADILKYDLGCNLVRASHYPQAPDFLDRCDEIGLLVLEEVPGWQVLGTGEWRDLEKQNLVDMVIRDRNHPSLLSWGCRANETVDDVWYKSMNDTARSLDPTRLTHGVRFSHGIDPDFFYEDIWTQNFFMPTDNPVHIPFITTEFAGHTIVQQAHAWDDDKILVNQIIDESRGHATGQNASYACERWAGLVGWCAFDYNSPHRNATDSDSGRGCMSYVSPHGVSSIFRLPKLAAYFYQSQRDPAFYGPMIRICNYWTPSSPTRVVVVSNCEEVALYQDNVLISKKQPELYPALPYPSYHWINVPFKSGELKAIGYIGGVAVATHGVKTPGNPATLTVEPDTTALFVGGDMTQVVVSLRDDYGQILHLRADSVTLSAGGSGDFVGEAKTALEGGQIAFYVKTRASQTGSITCQATCAGLSGSASIAVVKDSDIVTSIRSNHTANKPTNKKFAEYSFCGSRFFIPTGFRQDASLQLYNCSGKLIYRCDRAGKILDLKKQGIAQGVYIVRITGALVKGKMLR